MNYKEEKNCSQSYMWTYYKNAKKKKWHLREANFVSSIKIMLFSSENINVHFILVLETVKYYFKNEAFYSQIFLIVR